MTTLTETPLWETGIYQLETEDLVIGGPDGVDNLQAKQLANRTKFLKDLVDGLGTGKQNASVILGALSVLVGAADKLAYFTGANTAAMTSFTAFARTLLDDVDAATARATLGAAPLASPALTGIPTAPTPAAATNTTQLATTAFVQAALTALINSSPAALDQLNELAAALGNDPNFSTTIINALALKAPLNSPALTGNPTAPTPAQFDKSASLVTAAFLQRFGLTASAISSFSVTSVMTAESVGKITQVTSGSPITLTLPASDTCPNGSLLVLKNTGSSIFTLQRDGTDVIAYGNGTQNSLVVGIGDDIILCSNGGNAWFAISGSAQLSASSVFKSSIGSSGYQKFPGGRIEVHGTFVASSTPGAPVSVTFPLGATNLRNLQLTSVSSGTTAISTWFDTPTGSGFNGHCSVASAVVHYRAILD